nr:uncharacterized protein LOC101043204 [Saimiri boliviensis boliviensis]
MPEAPGHQLPFSDPSPARSRRWLRFRYPCGQRGWGEPQLQGRLGGAVANELGTSGGSAPAPAPAAAPAGLSPEGCSFGEARPPRSSWLGEPRRPSEDAPGTWERKEGREEGKGAVDVSGVRAFVEATNTEKTGLPEAARTSLPASARVEAGANRGVSGCPGGRTLGIALGLRIATGVGKCVHFAYLLARGTCKNNVT